MLLDSFAHLARADSSYHSTFRQLESFVRKQRGLQLIDPVLIARDLPLLDSLDVASALDEAVQRGVLAVRYTVLTPDGVVASDLFDSPRDIPPTLYDRFEVPFDTTTRPLVTVFGEANRSRKAKRSERADF